MKSEKPTKRRILQESEKGKSFNSRDLVAMVVLTGGGAATASLISLEPISALFTTVVERHFNLTVVEFMGMAVDAFALAVIPVFTACAVCVTVVSLAMSRGVLATKGLGIDFDRANPVNGFRNLFSVRALKELLKALLYSVALVLSGWFFLARDAHLVFAQISAPASSMGRAWHEIASGALTVLLVGALPVTAIVAALDFLIHYRGLKMEKFEVKQERYDNEGRPEIKQRRRDLGMELLNMQTKADVSGSAMILANPTHIAIGIYAPDDEPDMAFISVRETGTHALAVIAYAEQNGIPVVRDISLARRVFARSRRYTFIRNDDLEPVLRLLAWLREVEATRNGE